MSSVVKSAPPLVGSHREAWRIVKFGDVVRCVDVNERAPLENGLHRYVGLEHIDPEDLHVKRWGIVSEGTSFTRRFFSGQVLFGKRRAYQRKVAVAKFDGLCSGDILVFESRTELLLPELLPFIVQSDGFFDHALRTSAGSLSPRTKWKELAEYEFTLPPLDEQRRIAELLWAADKAATAIADSIASAQVAAASTAMKLFSGVGTTGRLWDVGTWLSGGTPSRANETYWSGTIPWASPKDMKADVLFDTIEHVTEEGASRGSKMAPSGSILFVVRGLILAHAVPLAVAGTNLAFNQDMRALVVAPDFSVRYIFHWLRHHQPVLLGLVADSSHGTKRIPMPDLLDTELPLPSRSSQNEIAGVLDQLDDGVRALRAHHAGLVSMRQRLALTLIPGQEGTNVQRG